MGVAGVLAFDMDGTLVDTAADIAVLSAGNTYLEVLHFRSPLPIRLDDPPTLFREGITQSIMSTPRATYCGSSSGVPTPITYRGRSLGSSSTVASDSVPGRDHT